MSIFFVFILIFLFTGFETQGNNYYVSNGGNDQNPGTLDQPFLTIQRAASLLQAGDICYIREGVYRETVTPGDNGKLGQPIIFTSFNQENVVITGLDIVQNWVPDEKNSWKAAVSEEVTQVFFNGRRGDEARFPNMSATMYDRDNWAQVHLNGDNSCSMTGISSLGNLKGAQVIGLCSSNWVAVSGVITSNSGDNFNVSETSQQFSESPEIYLGDGKGYLVGNKNLMDVPYEWYYNDNELFLIPPDQSDPNILNIEARVRFSGMNLNNKSYIQLKGLQFKAANLTMRNAIGCIVDECSFRYHIPFFRFGNGFNRDTSTPESWDGNGLEVSGSGNTIRNCYVAHSWGDGITIWGENNTLENCLIEDCDWLAIDSAPLSVAGTGHVIRGNTLRTTGRSILIHRHLAAAKIEYNDLYDGGLMTDDLGMTYSFETDGGGTEIAYNWLHDNKAELNGPGIYLDNGDANYLIHHNVVWNCSKGIQLNLPQTNTDVFNNTFWNNKNSMSEWGPDGTVMLNCRMWNNIQDFSTFIGNDQQNNLFSTKPCFVNPEAGNFELTDSSEAIDYGKVIDGITDNFTGKSPDAGAYEFGSSWSAGSTVKIPDFKDGLPATPTGFSAKVNPNQVILSWIGDSTNILGFAIDRKFGNGSFQHIGTVNPDVTSLIDSTIEPNKTYTYRLRAFNNFGSTMALHFITITTEGDGSSVLLEAEKFDEQAGIINNGSYIGGCDNGDYVMFRQIDFHDGFNFFTTRCAVPDGNAGQTVLIRIDGINGTIMGSFKVQGTGGWNNFEEESMSINEIKGIHDIYFVFSGTSGVGNFDWFFFSQNSSSSNQSIKVGKGVLLAQNFPNPFQNFTTIKYWLDCSTPVSIKVYDLYGHCVREITHSSQDEGSHTVSFNASDLAGGIYFYELKTDNYSTERKMLLIK